MLNRATSRPTPYAAQQGPAASKMAALQVLYSALSEWLRADSVAEDADDDNRGALFVSIPLQRLFSMLMTSVVRHGADISEVFAEIAPGAEGGRNHQILQIAKLPFQAYATSSAVTPRRLNQIIGGRGVGAIACNASPARRSCMRSLGLPGSP